VKAIQHIFILAIILFLIIPSLSITGQAGTAESQSDTTVINFEDSLANYFLLDYARSLTVQRYFDLVDSIKNHGSQDFLTLRLAYTQTAQYNPYDTQLSQRQTEIRRLINEEKYTAALFLADSILQDNFVDINTHLYCGFIYSQTGDSVKSNFHYYLYDQLLNSIFDSGDGLGPSTAFIVINTQEEYALLDWFKLRMQRQALKIVGGYRFDVLYCSDPVTNEEHAIFFNIELPYSHLNKLFRIQDDSSGND
jgi:hypothetical protein